MAQLIVLILGVYELGWYQTLELGRASKVVTHNSDGTKRITVTADSPDLAQGGGWGPYSGYATGTIDLTTIPRASSIDSFTASTSYLDSTFTIKYTPKATFNYKLRLSIPSVIAIKTNNLGSQGTGQKTATASFTAAELNTIYGRIGGSNDKCEIGAVIETWSGDTKIGESDELKLTLYIPASIKPSISSISISEAVSRYS